MSFLQLTQSRSAELAEYAQFVAQMPFDFTGQHPIEHSAHNHVHLWKLEYLADTYPWINTSYRVDFVNYIFDQWRRRLKGFSPYQWRGYRLYLYEDLAPTLSVVAETEIGFPYARGQAIVVPTVEDVLQRYAHRSWKQYFASPGWEISEKRLLNVVAKNNGSISKPTAEALGLTVGKLRILIINMGLAEQVNALRKRYRRSPADFSNDLETAYRWHVFEQCLPARY